MSNDDRFAEFRLQALDGLYALIKIKNLWTDEGEYYERIQLLLEELEPLLVNTFSFQYTPFFLTYSPGCPLRGVPRRASLLPSLHQTLLHRFSAQRKGQRPCLPQKGPLVFSIENRLRKFIFPISFPSFPC